MDGFPLRTAQLLMADLMGGLRGEDRFNVLTFASGSELMAERSVQASPEAMRQALTLVREKRGSGGTELLPALQRALKLPRAEGMARCVVLVTDGYVSVEAEAFDLMRERLGEAAFFTFGIGSSVNRHLLEGLAHIGGGEPFVVLNESAARAEAKRFLGYVSAPVLTQVRVAFEGFAVEAVQPAVVPDVYADRPLLLAGKWKGAARGRIKVSGVAAGRPYEAWIDVTGEAAKPGALTNPALRHYWARERVRELSDYAGLSAQENQRTRAEVTALGLKYGLLTAHTSFLAVDERPQLELLARTAVPVSQPLPIPQGVSQRAVGASTVSITGNAGSTPEPGTMSLLMLSLAALWFQRRR
jgi:Ca-activated chloride channel homolog